MTSWHRVLGRGTGRPRLQHLVEKFRHNKHEIPWAIVHYILNPKISVLVERDLH